MPPPTGYPSPASTTPPAPASPSTPTPPPSAPAPAPAEPSPFLATPPSAPPVDRAATPYARADTGPGDDTDGGSGPDPVTGGGLATGPTRQVAGGGATAARPGWNLVILTGPDGGRIVPLEEGRLALGRDPADGGVVLRDRHASRTHAFLDVSAGEVRVTDAGSLNGTFVDGEAAQGGPVEPGQSLRFGTTVAVLVQRRDNPYEISPTIAAPWLRAGGAGTGDAGLVLPMPPGHGGGFGLLRRGRGDGSYREVLEELAPVARQRHRHATLDRRLALPSAAHALALPPLRRLPADDTFASLTFGYAEQPSMFDIRLPEGLSRAAREEAERFVAAYAVDHDAPVAIVLTVEPQVDVVAPGGGAGAARALLR
jgi:hypothetical protein